MLPCSRISFQNNYAMLGEKITNREPHFVHPPPHTHTAPIFPVISQQHIKGRLCMHACIESILELS